MVTLYHNPACGTSRNTLALLRDRGVDLEVVEYLKTGWSLETLTDLTVQMGVGPRAILRERGTRAEALGLTDPATHDEAILAAMVLEPILVNRPIVVGPKGAALCRPAELALDLL